MKKRILFITALLTIALSAIGISLSSAASGDYIRIGLEYGSGAPSSAVISSENGLQLCTADAGLNYSDSPFDGLTSITIINEGSAVGVFDAAGNRIGTLAGDGSECIVSSDIFIDNDYINYNGKPFRGGIIPFINSSGKMNIINYLDLEDYIKGILDSEMGRSSALEALKAQAVTARSFAVANSSSHKAQGFAMCNTTHCQVYHGVEREFDRTNQAVDETKGLVMYYNGSPVAGYYYSNSGGHTENSEDVWVSALGYLRGRVDEFSPEMNWTVSLTRAQITKALSSKGIGNVTAVSIDALSSSGSVASLTVHGDKSSYTLTKDSIRSMFSSAATLRSKRFSISTEGGRVAGGSAGIVNAASDSTSESSWFARGISGIVEKLGSRVAVISASGRSEISLNGMYILGAGGNKVKAEYYEKPVIQQPSGSAVTTVYLDDDTDVLIISGSGYGHGVGMSQQGAQQMARLGYSFEDILHYYYTDIEVR